MIGEDRPEFAKLEFALTNAAIEYRQRFGDAPTTVLLGTDLVPQCDKLPPPRGASESSVPDHKEWSAALGVRRRRRTRHLSWSIDSGLAIRGYRSMNYGVGNNFGLRKLAVATSPER